jgi:nitrate reductase NapE component
MKEKIKEIISNYEPQKAAIRMGIVFVVGIITAIMWGLNESCLMAVVDTAAIVYGIRIFKAVPRINFCSDDDDEDYYEYRNEYSWMKDWFCVIITIMWPFIVATFVGWFLMIVEMVQSVIYCVKRGRERQVA